MFTTLRMFILPLLLGVLSTTAIAQQAVITGKVTDAESGEPLRGATVQVVETKKGGYTDTKGEYRVKKVAAGTYTLKFTFVGYDAKTITNVVVADGETKVVDVLLGMTVSSATEVVIQADRINDNAAALLAQRQKASTVSDGIGKEEINKLPDSDAGQALRRVTGVTLVEGKYVYVRGVSDRYSNTTLNGSALSTTEPDKKSFAFDMFPSELLENVNIAKSFTPDLPGNFVGGLVQMNTIDFPQGYALKFSTGIAGNDYVTNHTNQFITSESGPTDWIGLDGGWRAAPADMPNSSDFAALRSQVRAGDAAATQEWIQLGQDFNNEVMNREVATAPFAGKGSLLLTNVWDVAEESRLGLVASLNWGSAYTMNRMFRSQLQSDGAELFAYNGSVTGRSVNTSALANIAYKIGSQSTVSLKNTYSISTDDDAVYQFGQDFTQSQLRKNLSFQYVEKQLFSTVLAGEHNVAFASNLLVEWKAGYSQSRRNEPDHRRLRFQKDAFSGDETPMEITIANGGVTTQGSGSDAGRFYSMLNEYARNLQLNGTLSLNATKVKVGGLYDFKNRDFTARSFTFIQSPNSVIDYSLLTASADPNVVPSTSALFADSNYAYDRLGMSEDSRKRDSYIASESLVAGYAMVDVPFEIGTMPVRVIAGARVESSQQILNSFDATDAPVNVNLDIVDVLPSVNIVVTPFENFNVRAAATQTLTRPSLREFAPFQFYDFQSQSATQGNPDLTRALVQNYDLRLEWFPGAGEVISVSAFYKNFLNAIEETIIPSGGSTILFTFANANGPATNYGVEFEIRKNMGFIATPLQYLIASANVALITSEVTVNQVNVADTRQMWGQSPYTVNLGLSYFNPDWGTTISAGYNIAGDRIVKVAQQGVYQVPADLQDRGPHVYELARDVIDFSVAQTIGNLELKAAIRDVLNQPLVWEQIGQTVASNLRGRGYSLSIGYRFN